MPVKKGTGQMKDSGFSRPYGPFSAKDAKKIADAIEKGSSKKPAPKKPVAPRTSSTGAKKPMPKLEGAKPGVKKPMPKVGPKPTRTIAPKPKPKPKPKEVQMPSKISPFKMTPAQKADYLKNPDRYNG